MTMQKKSRRSVQTPPPGPAPAAAASRNGSANLSAYPSNPFDSFYWEDRVAAWLGIARKRILSIRRRALTEGPDWTVRDWQVVYTRDGIEKLRNLLADLRVSTSQDGPSQEKAEPPAPSGPPEHEKAKVVRIYANSRLMQAMTTPSDPEKKPALVMVRVRDNKHFMQGMIIDVVHDARSEHWQFSGRLPRRRGKW
jgi:hypothetical protein